MEIYREMLPQLLESLIVVVIRGLLSVLFVYLYGKYKEIKIDKKYYFVSFLICILGIVITIYKYKNIGYKHEKKPSTNKIIYICSMLLIIIALIAIVVIRMIV